MSQQFIADTINCNKIVTGDNTGFHNGSIYFNGDKIESETGKVTVGETSVFYVGDDVRGLLKLDPETGYSSNNKKLIGLNGSSQNTIYGDSNNPNLVSDKVLNASCNFYFSVGVYLNTKTITFTQNNQTISFDNGSVIFIDFDGNYTGCVFQLNSDSSRETNSGKFYGRYLMLKNVSYSTSNSCAVTVNNGKIDGVLNDNVILAKGGACMLIESADNEWHSLHNV